MSSASVEFFLARLREQAERWCRWCAGPAQAVGLDIGSSSAKAAHVLDAGDRIEVRLFGGTAVRGADGQPSPQAAERLRELMEGWGFPAAGVVANLSGQDCLTRRIRLPFADKAKAARMAPFELEQQLPLPMDQLVFELYPFGGEEAVAPTAAGNGEEAENPSKAVSMLALVTPKERLSRRLALLAAANVAPVAVEADALALYHVFCALWPGVSEAAVLDLGAGKSTLLLVRSGCLRVVRTIPWGADVLTAALAADWSVPFAHAERMKCERCSIVDPANAGGASKARIEASSIICRALEPLIREIRRTLLAEGQDASGSEVLPPAVGGPLLVCGGGSLLPGVRDYLGRELGCRVAPLGASERLALSTENDPVQEALLPPAVGLALRRLRKMSQVDFRRPELQPKVTTMGKGWRACAAAAVVLSIVLGLVGVHLRLSAREARLKEVAGRAEEVYQGAFPGRSAPDPLRQMERKLAEAEKEPLPDGDRPHAMLDVLRAVSSDAAAGGNVKVKVTHLTIERLGVVIQGEAESREVVVRLRMALLKSRFFKDCVVKEVVPNGTRVRFGLELKRRDVGQAQA
ncbi:MAG: cell division FtsA domain-containing protein [Pseudomonadota bacterium]